MTVASDRQTFAAVSIKMIAALVREVRRARGLKSDSDALSPPYELTLQMYKEKWYLRFSFELIPIKRLKKI